MSYLPFCQPLTRSARSLRLAAPARVLSWVGNLIPPSGEAGQGLLVDLRSIETRSTGLNPQGKSPVPEGRAPKGSRGSIVALSANGSASRVFKLDNHFAWLAVSLHLLTAPGAALARSASPRSVLEAGEGFCSVPDGNHGENNRSSANHAGEVSR